MEDMVSRDESGAFGWGEGWLRAVKILRGVRLMLSVLWRRTLGDVVAVGLMFSWLEATETRLLSSSFSSMMLWVGVGGGEGG